MVQLLVLLLATSADIAYKMNYFCMVPHCGYMAQECVEFGRLHFIFLLQDAMPSSAKQVCTYYAHERDLPTDLMACKNYSRQALYFGMFDIRSMFKIGMMKWSAL